MLTPEAAVMAIEEPWDPEQMRTISKIDTTLDALAGEVEHDFEWLSGSEEENEIDIIKDDRSRYFKNENWRIHFQQSDRCWIDFYHCNKKGSSSAYFGPSMSGN